MKLRRLGEIREENKGHPLASVSADWLAYEQKVVKAVPNFAAPQLFQAQEFALATYARAFDKVISQPFLGLFTLDQEYGARIVDIGGTEVTRPFLDSNTEWRFLERYLPAGDMGVLDIGAGYGRLARFLSRIERFKPVFTVDAVPVSTWLCEQYCAGSKVETLTLRKFEERYTALDLDVVINIHSWNECTYAQVARWLEYVLKTKAFYLFTVTANYFGVPYHTCEDGHKSFLPLLEEHFTKIAEEPSVMRYDCPMALWSRK
jgi:SAM-dependent methyltransferase